MRDPPEYKRANECVVFRQINSTQNFYAEEKKMSHKNLKKRKKPVKVFVDQKVTGVSYDDYIILDIKYTHQLYNYAIEEINFLRETGENNKI